MEAPASSRALLISGGTAHAHYSHQSHSRETINLTLRHQEMLSIGRDLHSPIHESNKSLVRSVASPFANQSPRSLSSQEFPRPSLRHLHTTSLLAYAESSSPHYRALIWPKADSHSTFQPSSKSPSPSKSPVEYPQKRGRAFPV